MLIPNIVYCIAFVLLVAIATLILRIIHRKKQLSKSIVCASAAGLSLLFLYSVASGSLILWGGQWVTNQMSKADLTLLDATPNYKPNTQIIESVDFTFSIGPIPKILKGQNFAITGADVLLKDHNSYLLFVAPGYWRNKEKTNPDIHWEGDHVLIKQTLKAAFRPYNIIRNQRSLTVCFPPKQPSLKDIERVGWTLIYQQMSPSLSAYSRQTDWMQMPFTLYDLSKISSLLEKMSIADTAWTTTTTQTFGYQHCRPDFKHESNCYCCTTLASTDTQVEEPPHCKQK